MDVASFVSEDVRQCFAAETVAIASSLLTHLLGWAFDGLLGSIMAYDDVVANMDAHYNIQLT